MGEVWKGFDPLLKRDVAVKIAAQQFTDRFEREALATAALNHKNICTLYDVGPDYLVLELVEGPTLAERIAQGPIPLDEALGIAKQIAAGLESAHEKPIVHRDLKPANVKIKPDGTVKVLDFGLAKAASAEEEPGPDSPTMAPGTRAGMILGTAGYMSPEQARGQKADKRADIWAFGVVLWEMVTGKQLFGGPTVPDSLAAILTREPDLTLAPEKIRRLLARCLEKDPQNRLRDIGDAMGLVDTEPSATAPSRSRLSKAGWIAAGVATAIAAALAFVHFREKPPETPVVRSTILPPEKTSFREGLNYPALSPDGRRLLFGAQSADGVSRLWVRALDSIAAQPLAGTEGAVSPFWSPDGRSIGFTLGNRLKKIDVSSGPAIALADLPGSRGASWSPRGVIVFAPLAVGPLMRIPVAGGPATPATALDPARKENTHRWPWFLPDGRHFLYTATLINTDEATIYVGSLDSRETRIVAQANSNAIYASGYLFFLRDNTLMAQPFDAKRLTTTGETVAVAEQVAMNPTARGLFAVSENGTLVFQSGGQGALTLAWMDRTGRRLATVGEPGQLLRTALSPDGKGAMLSVYDRDARNYDLWIYDLARNLRTRFTFDPGNEREGIWSPDGSQIVFSSDRRGHRDLYRKLASGAGGRSFSMRTALTSIPQAGRRTASL